MQHLTRWGFFVWLVMLAAIACTPEEDPFINTDEERAAAIRAATPTELPPVTTTGENTMGAYIIPTPGSELHQLAGQDTILFVASGVQRGGSIGTISTSCRPFQNWRFESREVVSIIGTWCPRPEISDPRAQTLSLSYRDDGSASIFYAFDFDGGSTTNELAFLSDSSSLANYQALRDDPSMSTLSLTFGSVLVNYDSGDSVIIRSGRLDATYGSTP